MDDQIRSAFYQQEEPGYLRISGPDRMAFLQRQTTNDIGLLTPDRPVVTILTSPAGRILDVLWVIDEGESYGVITLPGQGAQTFQFLHSRIFFMDKISIENISHDFSQVDLLGQAASELLQELGAVQEFAEDEILSINIAGVPVRVLYQGEMGFRLLVPIAALRQVLSKIEEMGMLPLSPEHYEILRIEAGQPVAGHELIEDYTPLEIGFSWAISDNKGCYTGQEVIARQVNFDKVTRQMVGLRMSEIPQIGDSLYARDNNQPVGKITSRASSPHFGVIALAVIKRPFHQPGNELVIHQGDQTNKAVTTALPFQ